MSKRGGKFKTARAFYAVLLTLIIVSICVSLVACNDDNKRTVKFTYSDKTYTSSYGAGTNGETYDAVTVNTVEGLRDDFVFGVDASTVAVVERSGGKFYNLEGKEQDVFQILKENGVNFFRVRIWNDPKDMFGSGYGGGENDTAVSLALAKRAAAVGMNVMVDLHYSDFWADPEQQDMPKDWASLSKDKISGAIYDFTKKVLTDFKAAGVNVSMIQIGNEINNGLVFPYGKINWSDVETSFDYVADLLSSGIKASRDVFPDIYTAIHLANGGSFDEFDKYFGELEERKVDYDIIGVSYYPYYHGAMSNLQNNLNKMSAKYEKPTLICEMSYGFTTEDTDYAQNIYNDSMEDGGGYCTSIQGQATFMRDVIASVAAVPNQMGLGVFYWEPAWLPVDGASWASAVSGRTDDGTDGLSTWANQAWFSYTGKALPSIEVYKKVKNGDAFIEDAVSPRNSKIELTINLAADETLPETVLVNTNLDAIREWPVAWNTQNQDLTKIGTYTVIGGLYNKAGKYIGQTQAAVSVIVNHVKDPGYELQSAASDRIGSPWTIKSSTPSDQTVVKLNRKVQDIRTGATDMNWYCADKDFAFEVTQNITSITESGTFELSSYLMGVKVSELAHNSLEMFITVNGVETKLDLLPFLKGWSNGYVKVTVSGIKINAGDTVVIGLRGNAAAGAWGHMDDWTLVKL